MFGALLTGFFLGISLIVVIGAQNAFVLRQGILRQHNFYVALFCSFADALLICVGSAFISIQKWLNNIKPTHVSKDWHGKPLGNKHKIQLKEN